MPAPQIPRSDLPHGGSFPAGYHPFAHEPLPTLHEDATLTLSAIPYCVHLHTRRDKETSSKKRPGTQVPSAQPTADGLRTHPTRRLRFWHYLRSRLAPKPSQGGIRGWLTEEWGPHRHRYGPVQSHRHRHGRVNGRKHMPKVLP
jgi:hypothetical protein